jgi:hypothetical protein
MVNPVFFLYQGMINVNYSRDKQEGVQGIWFIEGQSGLPGKLCSLSADGLNEKFQELIRGCSNHEPDCKPNGCTLETIVAAARLSGP